jgi:hypothetical protein
MLYEGKLKIIFFAGKKMIFKKLKIMKLAISQYNYQLKIRKHCVIDHIPSISKTNSNNFNCKLMQNPSNLVFAV